MKIVAMIPARLGSKRIPKKNLRILIDKPLIKYAIDISLSSNVFDEIWVNSESDSIGKLALESGVKFYKRPSYLSSDTATNNDFTGDFLKNVICDYVVMINPTSPLISIGTVRNFVDLVRKMDYDTILSVIEEYAECFFEGKPINFSLDEKVNSQNLRPVKKVVWALTAWKRETFLSYYEQNRCATFCGKIGLFAIPLEEGIDIDTEDQWRLAEALLNVRQNSGFKRNYWDD